MKHMRIYASFGLGLSLALASTHCGSSKPSHPVFGASLPAGTDAPISSDTGGVVTGSFSPNATKAQLLKGSANSNIAGVTVAFPIGSLAIATDITMREGASLDKDLLVGELALDAATVSTSGAVIEISSTKPIDLTLPMVVALPLPVGFNLSVSADSLKTLGVVYRIQSQASGDNIIGFEPASGLQFDKNNNLLYPSKYFGSFQVVAFDREVTRIQKLASIPLHDGLEMILTGMALPSCGKADLGRTVYVQDLSQFQYCSADGWQVIDLKGPTGSVGATGATGAPGATGATGAAGADGGVYLFDNSGISVGLFLNLSGPNALIKIGAGGTLGFLGVNVFTGALNASCATGNCAKASYYKADSCAGAPYFTDRPIRNAVVVSGTSTFFKSTGAETATSNGPFVSSLVDNVCSSISTTSFTSFSIPASYTMPTGQTPPPYVGPMYIGP